MDIKKLRYFSAIVQEGSFTKAASRLNIAQSALSLHIQTIENQIGKPLLMRGAKGVTPTEAGTLLYQRAQQILVDLDRLKQDMTDFGEDPQGTVRIGLPGTISNILSEPLIAACRERYPNIKLVIAEAMSGFVKNWLISGDVDLALLYLDLQELDLSSSLLMEEEIVLIEPPLPKAAKSEKTESLSEKPLILPSQSHGLRIMLEGQMKTRGGSLNPVIEIDSYPIIKSLVEKGYGCSFLPRHAIHKEAAEGRLMASPLPDQQIWRRIFLAQSTSRPLSSASSTIVSLIREQTRYLVENGIWAGARLL